ncbi:SIR2 family protein, partial [Photobacterium phosphoreum]|uniref:SIR2 family protein n=1 Tax=Photobacterium phosphoreum TaxID=659 RepID=UPI000D15A8F3
MNSYNVKDLAEYMKQAKKKGQPFVLFTGAGCSKSAGMPLASELVDVINEEYALDLKALSDEDKRDYGRCMSALTKDDRRDLLQRYIKKANINWAHIVQALLLEQEYIQRVFTFNFDNILARSCGLIGLYPSTYDFTVANFDLLDLIINPAIVHLHGQSHGFAQLNTDKETNLHADRLSQFIATTLSQSPSLFIGYSGQADAFFPLLKDKFSDQKKLFWIGRDKIAPKHINDSLIIPNNAAHYLHHSDADRFFIELAQELECFPPLVFNDPFGYLLKQFDSILDFPASENIELDILTSTRLNLKKAQQLEIDSKKPNLEGLFMEGKYEELVKQAEDIELIDEEKLSVAWSFIMMANGLANEAEKEDNKEIKINLFYQSIEIYKKALEIKCDMPEALNNIGLSYFNLAKIKNDDELFKLSAEKYKSALNINPNNYDALCNLGNTLSWLASKDNDLNLSKESIDQYKNCLLYTSP